MSRDPFVLSERAIAMGNCHGNFSMLSKKIVHVNEILVDVHQFAVRRPRLRQYKTMSDMKGQEQNRRHEAPEIEFYFIHPYYGEFYCGHF